MSSSGCSWSRQHVLDEHDAGISGLRPDDEREDRRAASIFSTLFVSAAEGFNRADAFDAHLEGAAERAKGATKFLEFKEFEIYGSPSDEALEMMKQSASGGASLMVRPNFVEGYLGPEASETTT